MFGPSHRIIKIFSLVLVAVLFYFLARMEFLIWNWSLFKNKPAQDLLWSFIVGLRFDVVATLTLAAPLILLSLIPWPQSWNRLWRHFTWISFSLLQAPLLILNLVDTEFINFVGRRFTYDSLFLMNELSGKMWNFVSSYWLLFVVNTLLVVLFVVVVRKVALSESSVVWTAEKKSGKFKLWGAHIFLSFVALVVSVIGIRGGLQAKPINFVNANVFTAPLLNNLVLNSTFTFIKSYGAEGLSKAKYFNDKDEMLSLLNGSLRGSLLDGKRAKKPQNIVVIILESFGEEYMGPVHGGKSYTPFLDSLKSKSLSFENAYANGRRSIEGVGAIMGGIPALMNEPFISSHFTANYFLGLGTLLAPHKFSSSFFHGGHNGTMYFDSFMQSAGVEKYYGAREYGNTDDDDGVWGIWDEPFLQWMLTQVDDMPQPFMTSVFTLSSHQPFKVPPQYTDRFPEGPLPILKAVEYTDYALQKFFEEAAQKPWFKNTLFVITADHTSMHYRPEYQNEQGNYRIPLLLYHPSFKLPAVDTQMVVQQIDILPTVLDFLGIADKDQNYLGSSVFVPGDKVAVNFIDGRYILFGKDYSVLWSPGHGEPQMFAMTDRAHEKDLSASPADAVRRDQLVQRLKATIQYFNEGMWDNKLYYPSK